MKNLINNHKRILSRINRLSEGFEPHWGEMTVAQMFCHCTDQLNFSMNASNQPKTSLWGRTFLKWKVLRTDLPYNIGWVENNGRKPESFEMDKAHLIDSIHLFLQKSEDSKWAKHPIFGTLTKKEWGRIAYKHLNSHLNQFGA